MSTITEESRPRQLTNEPRALKSALDYCLYFTTPDAGGGCIYVSGWVYQEAGADPGKVVVRTGDHVVASFDCLLDRPDVQVAFPGAPVRSGFEAYIPVREGDLPSHPLTISFEWNGHRAEIGRRRPFDVSDLNRLAPVIDGLTPRKRRKLANLVLNEQERLAKATRLRSKPLYLMVDPSFACQLRCPHCHSTMLREAGLSEPALTRDLMDDILEQYGDSLIALYFFLHGEPLLNHNFASMVRRAHEREIWTATSSNFSMPLSDEDLESIVRSGLDLMILSIDGATAAVYRRYRVHGDLELVLSNVRRLVEQKRALGSRTPVLRWQYLIFPWNEHETQVAGRMASELGIEEFCPMLGNRHPRIPVRIDKPAAPLTVPIAAAHRERLEVLRDRQQSRFQYFGCDHLYQQMCVNSDGSVHPCGYAYEPRHTVAQAGGGVDIFNSEALQANRGLYRGALEPGTRAYDPCAGCWIIGKNQENYELWPNHQKETNGHVRSALSFFEAFDRLTGQPLAMALAPALDGAAAGS